MGLEGHTSRGRRSSWLEALLSGVGLCFELEADLG